MKREEYAFAYNLNGTGTPGIVTLTNPPRLICLCSKENSRLILDALNSSLPPAEGAEAIQPHITCPKCGSTNNSELAKNDRLCYDCNHSWSEQQPTAEGAEEILPTAYEWHNLKTGHCYVDYVPHLDAKEGYTKIPLYSTLHAQKIADKMVSEMVREELIAFIEHGQKKSWMLRSTVRPEYYIDEYLKSRDGHE